ncbi:phage tail protein [Salibacterium lacus]|uniref:Phage tail tape measure protein n=1 Tax=Salibacterium lacus TaxID=1898109 RepID=A0ABW5T1T6_9BACI
MAKRIKGITIELDGETKGLDKALSNVNKRSKNLQSELQDVDKLLKFNPGNTDLIAQKQKLLADQVENTSSKLDQLRDAQSQVQQQFESGEIGEEQYRSFQREITETESKLSTFETKLQESQQQANKFADKMQNASEKMKGIGDGLKDTGGKMSGFLTGPILAGLGAVTKGTEEYRQNLSKLQTNAEQAGVGADAMNDALVRLSGVSDDTNANVEALSNLLASGFDQQGMTKAMDALSGAVVKFPDTLKMESLADGLQETISTGKAVGPFSELIDRLGIDMEKFNQGLQKATENGNAQNYVLQTLADSGLSKVNEEYRKNNEELVKSQEAQANFKQSMAELGSTLEPIVTKATTLVTKLVSKFNDLSPTAQKISIAIGGIAAAIGPLLVVMGTLISSVGNIISVVTKLGPVFSVLTGPVGLVIAAIAALAAGLVIAYKRSETFRNVVNKAWEAIKTAWQATMDFFTTTLPQWVNNIVKWFKNLGTQAKNVWNAIKNTLSTVWQAIKTAVMTVIKGIWTGIKQYFKLYKTIIKTVMKAIKTTIKTIWKAIKTVFTTTVNAIKTFIQNSWKRLKNITSTVFNAIKNTIKTIWNGIKTAFTTTVNAIKNALTAAWNTIKNTTQTVFNTVKTTIQSIWNSIKSWFSSALSGIASTVSSKMTEAKNSIQNIWNQAKSFLSSINLTQIGRDIIQGLLNGISEMASQVWNKAKEIADGIKDRIQGALNINSPSKVTAELGRFTGEGLVVGMEAMQKKIRQASDRMAQAATPSMPSVATPDMNGGAGGTTEMNNFRGMMEGANLTVREEADIEKISRDLFRQIENRKRGSGRR